jgi:cell division protein FtsQ
VKIQVDTKGDLFFINNEMVEEMIFSKVDSLIGKAYEDINIYLLEEFVNGHPNIKKAELYLTLDGTLSIDVIQREPIVRVFEGNESYYLDEEMNHFALSDQYSARVLQVYWDEITVSRITILDSLIDFIDSDKFLKAQITAIAFDEKNEIVLYPRVGDHKIILGVAGDFKNKFEKLKVFYRQGLGKVGWDRYSMINLKYHNQVVCTKR